MVPILGLLMNSLKEPLLERRSLRLRINGDLLPPHLLVLFRIRHGCCWYGAFCMALVPKLHHGGLANRPVLPLPFLLSRCDDGVLFARRGYELCQCATLHPSCGPRGGGFIHHPRHGAEPAGCPSAPIHPSLDCINALCEFGLLIPCAAAHLTSHSPAFPCMVAFAACAAFRPQLREASVFIG